MAQITIWGDFKADKVDHLNMSGELQLLLNQSDINAVNFEAPVKSDGKAVRKSGPNLSQNVDSPEWIEAHGFNVVSLANNHAMDYGKDGLNATKASFKKAKTIGAGAWDEAYHIEVLQTSDGKKIGFLAATHQEFGMLKDRQSEIGCAWCMHPDFERQILNGGGLDFLIVINHAGIEYMDYPLPEWREVYRKWIDLGADAVIASHPHVPQGWEFYKGKPICYSLGNFCFQKEGNKKAHWDESLCCVINVEEDKKASVTIKNIYYDAAAQYLRINGENQFREHIEKINSLLSEEKEYIDRVNESCLALLPKYYGLFSRSGFITGITTKEFLKGLAERFKKEHAFNCINCESHRWAIERAMRLKYKIR